MTSAGKRKRPAPAESTWTEATFSIKKKAKKHRDRGPVRLIENWCRPCISRLEKDLNHRCSNQTGIGRKCVDCLDKKSNCSPLPRIVIPAAKAALAAAEAVEDKDEDSMQIFYAAVTKARKAIRAQPNTRTGKSPTDSTTTTTTTRKTTTAAITPPAASAAAAAAAAGRGGSEWAADFLEFCSRIANKLEEIHSDKIAYSTRKQDYEDDDDRDEDGDYDG